MTAHHPSPPGTDLSRFDWYRYQGRPDGPIFYYAYDEASRTLYCESALEGLYKRQMPATWQHLLTYRDMTPHPAGPPSAALWVEEGL